MIIIYIFTRNSDSFFIYFYESLTKLGKLKKPIQKQDNLFFYFPHIYHINSALVTFRSLSTTN